MSRTIPAVLFTGAFLAVVAAAAADDELLGGRVVPISFTEEPGPNIPAPPLPSFGLFPVQMVLDDGIAEGSFSFSGATARQFMWLNRFNSPGAFTLDEIWVLFPNNADVPLGGAIELAVFLDSNADPANGTELLATYDVTIQAKDGSTFSVYPLATTLDVPAGGSVLIGVINRYFMTGSDPPPTAPAALDTSLSQSRSYVALWTGDPPASPTLDTALVIDLLDGAAAGNGMIRGFGSQAVLPSTIPVLDGFALALLAALLGLAGAVLLMRR